MKTRKKYGFKSFISAKFPLSHTDRNREPFIRELISGDKIFYVRDSGEVRVGIFKVKDEKDILAYWGNTYETLDLSCKWVPEKDVYLDIPENQHLKRRNPS